MAASDTYIKLHDGMPDHPKIVPLSDGAFRLLIETWCWCNRHLTDGVVAESVWAKRGTPRQRKELVDAGIAEPGGIGVVMHDYSKHQTTAAEVEAIREHARLAGRAGGLAKAKRAASTVPSTVPSKPSGRTPSPVCLETEAETEVTTPLPSPSPKPRPLPKSRPLPEDWKPSQRIMDWFFAQKGHDRVSWPNETRAFMDYCDAHRKLYADHDAAFRNWLRNRLPGGRFDA
jgi:hypothetical protein